VLKSETKVEEVAIIITRKLSEFFPEAGITFDDVEPSVAYEVVCGSPMEDTDFADFILLYFEKKLKGLVNE